MADKFTDRLIVVTGAGSGIGRETALAFAERGAKVIAADIDEESATRTAELATSLAAKVGGPESAAYRVDVADAPAMERFAEAVQSEHGVPDVVVNNAGIGMAGSFLDTDPKDWDRIIGINLYGVIYGCRLFGRQMVERRKDQPDRRAHIVNVASAAAFTPNRAMSAYATTKAAVLMLSECLRAELVSQGIGVSAICPGIVNTDIVRTTQFVGMSAAEQSRAQQTSARLYGRRNFPPRKVAAQIVRAVEGNKAMVPVAVEAKVSRVLSRLSPTAMRLMARVDPAERLTRR